MYRQVITRGVQQVSTLAHTTAMKSGSVVELKKFLSTTAKLHDDEVDAPQSFARGLFLGKIREAEVFPYPNTR